MTIYALGRHRRFYAIILAAASGACGGAGEPASIASVHGDHRIQALQQEQGPAAASGIRPGVGNDSLPRGLKLGYATSREDLAAASGVDVLVPSIVLGSTADDSLYVTVPQVDETSYSVFYSRAYGCSGGGGCRDASVTGERLGPGSPMLDAGRPVEVAPGVRGTYVPSVCGGGGCSEPQLWWEVGGARYTVGLKAGRLSELTRMARSMTPLDSVHDPR